MAKRNTKKNKKKNAADKKKKKMVMIEGDAKNPTQVTEQSSAGEKAVFRERNSTQEPEMKLGDTSSSSSEGDENMIDGGDTNASEDEKEEVDERETLSMEEAERIDEEESWINQDSSERKPLSPLLFIAKLDASDADAESNRLVLKRCHERMEAALSLTQKFKEIPYIRVLARDPQKREHQLRFSRYDDVQQGAFILHHEWAKIVADNGLKEGDIVIGRGNFVDHQFRTVLSFTNVAGETGVISRERNTNPEKKKGEGFIFLFEKKMDRGDLKQLVIDYCSEKLKMAMQRTKEPYIRVLASDPKIKMFELRLSRSVQRGTYILRHEWEELVDDNGLKEGDTVTGFGEIFSLGITMEVHFIKNGELDRAIRGRQLFFFFDKKLESPDTDTLLSRLEIGSCKEVVREIVARAEKDEESDGYVRISGIDDKDREYELRLSRYIPKEGYVLHHQWGDVVTAYGLMSGDKVSCWGSFAADGTIWMKIDVDKAPENVGLEPY